MAEVQIFGNPICSNCCDPPTPPCADTIINVWDRMHPGQQAQGMVIGLDWVQTQFYNPTYPYRAPYAEGPPGHNFGVLPPQSYWGYPGRYVPTFYDTDNDRYVIPYSNNGQLILVDRCNSLHMSYCKVTIDVATEDGATCEAYAPDYGSTWGIWVKPHRNVTYSLSLANATPPTTVSDPITGRPVKVVVSASKECTFGNCKEVYVQACGDSYAVDLPLYTYCGEYYPPPNYNGVDCQDKGCLVRGPGPDYAGYLYRTITVVFTPYLYTNFNTMTGEPYNDPVTGEPRPRWEPDQRILGTDWGKPFVIESTSPGVWDSGCIAGGNGRPAYQSTYSYDVYYQSRRVMFTSNGLVYTAYTVPGCNGGFMGQHSYGAPDCAPTDIEIYNTVSGQGGGTLLWFKAYQ